MKKKQLTAEQIAILFNLTERNGVTYYDVQIEIVDHYASAIEKMWEVEPELNFYRAQERVYKEFWNLKGLERTKSQLLLKQANKASWQQIRNIFLWPNSLSFVLFFAFFATLLPLIENYAHHILTVIILVWGLLYQYYSAIVKRFEKTLNKSFLALETTIQSYAIIFPFLLVFGGYILADAYGYATWARFPLSLSLALFVGAQIQMNRALWVEINKLKRQFI